MFGVDAGVCCDADIDVGRPDEREAGRFGIVDCVELEVDVSIQFEESAAGVDGEVVDKRADSGGVSVGEVSQPDVTAAGDDIEIKGAGAAAEDISGLHVDITTTAVDGGVHRELSKAAEGDVAVLSAVVCGLNCQTVDGDRAVVGDGGKLAESAGGTEVAEVDIAVAACAAVGVECQSRKATCECTVLVDPRVMEIDVAGSAIVARLGVDGGVVGDEDSRSACNGAVTGDVSAVELDGDRSFRIVNEGDIAVVAVAIRNCEGECGKEIPAGVVGAGEEDVAFGSGGTIGRVDGQRAFGIAVATEDGVAEIGDSADGIDGCVGSKDRAAAVLDGVCAVGLRGENGCGGTVVAYGDRAFIRKEGQRAERVSGRTDGAGKCDVAVVVGSGGGASDVDGEFACATDAVERATDLLEQYVAFVGGGWVTADVGVRVEVDCGDVAEIDVAGGDLNLGRPVAVSIVETENTISRTSLRVDGHTDQTRRGADVTETHIPRNHRHTVARCIDRKLAGAIDLSISKRNVTRLCQWGVRGIGIDRE